MKRRWKAAVIGLGAIMGIALLGVVLVSASHPRGVHALEVFYSRRSSGMDIVTEDMQMDPLILAGRGVVPFVLRDISRPSMPKRRYAIGFLGNGRYREALPVLRALLADTGESELVRGDALEAIAQIDKTEGQALATTWAAKEGFLGMTAREVLSGVEPEGRTYLQALIGCHDCRF